MHPGEAWSVERKDFRNVLLWIGFANQAANLCRSSKTRYFHVICPLMSKNIHTVWLFWLVMPKERHLGTPNCCLNLILKQLEEEVVVPNVGRDEHLWFHEAAAETVSGVLMREAAQQEKGIFWCLSSSQHSLLRLGTCLIRTILQRLESARARAMQFRFKSGLYSRVWAQK